MDYFGNNTDGDGTSLLSSYAAWNVPAYIDWVCPNTGDQAVNELGVKVYVTSGSANVRCAIYTTGGAFVMQGETEILVTETDTNGVWKTHTTFVNQAGEAIASPILVGGTSYVLCNTADGSTCRQRRTAVTNGYTRYGGSEYTGGWPSTLSLGGGSTGTNLAVIRCGVTPVSSGLSIPVAMASYRRRRI